MLRAKSFPNEQVLISTYLNEVLFIHGNRLQAQIIATKSLAMLHFGNVRLLYSAVNPSQTYWHKHFINGISLIRISFYYKIIND